MSFTLVTKLPNVLYISTFLEKVEILKPMLLKFLEGQVVRTLPLPALKKPDSYFVVVPEQV
jgi:hypothetical protein